MGSTQSELRLGALMDARELVHGKHEAKLSELDDKDASHDDNSSNSHNTDNSVHDSHNDNSVHTDNSVHQQIDTHVDVDAGLF